MTITLYFRLQYVLLFDKKFYNVKSVAFECFWNTVFFAVFYLFHQCLVFSFFQHFNGIISAV